MEIILNKCYGCFDLSEAGYLKWAEKLGAPIYEYAFTENGFVKVEPFSSYRRHKVYSFIDYGEYLSDGYNQKALLICREEDRTDLCLIETIKELGKNASCEYSNLQVVEIPDGMDYIIDNYDGYEKLHQRVQEW